MNSKSYPNLVCVTGHTAAGKTAFAAHLADVINGEIISADSRQIYRHMDKGTGKDYQDYIVNGRKIPYHLIDIADPGYEYNVFEYQKDFITSFQDIRSRDRIPVLCGGTGMYIEAVLKGYSLIQVPPNQELRQKLSNLSQEELISILRSYKTLHNITDTEQRKRLVRAIEIAEHYQEHPEINTTYPELHYIIFGIRFDRDSRRERITARLKERLKGGMIEETQTLMDMGISEEKLVYYGLEYKYLAWYLNGRLSYDEMFLQLNTAIHQFAKRQMTWFRKMEREGMTIHWLDGYLPLEEKLRISVELLNNFQPGLKEG